MRGPRLPIARAGLVVLFLGVAVDVTADEEPTPPESASFIGLGHFPEGIPASRAFDVSADGMVVVGAANTAQGLEAFRWTMSDGLVGLGDLPGGGFTSLATGASGDGGLIVGWSWSEEGLKEAFVWDQDEGMMGLGDLPGGPYDSVAAAVAAGVFDDGGGDDDPNDLQPYGGVVVVGWGSGPDTEREAFRWTIGGGMVGLGDLPGGNFMSLAAAVSGDGSVIAGTGSTGTPTVQEAFRWTREEGMVGLGFCPDNFIDGSGARDMTADGEVIVGWCWGENGIEALRWTEDDGMEALGDLPGGGDLPFSHAYAVSDDGATIVGVGKTDLGGEAFIWTEDDGMRNLRALLEDDYGLDLSGWILREAWGVSADGRTIVGAGDHDGVDEAWRARLVSSCPADLNGDGRVDQEDLIILIGNQGPCADCDDCPADLNGDCVVNFFDLIILLDAWGDCPD